MLRLLKPITDQGNAEAQINLGVLYANGWGVAQDYVEALKWYRKAADQDIPEALALSSEWEPTVK